MVLVVGGGKAQATVGSETSNLFASRGLILILAGKTSSLVPVALSWPLLCLFVAQGLSSGLL